MVDFLESFKGSLGTGFIDKNLDSKSLYQPKLLVNSKEPRRKVLTSILSEFEACESFFISVAFVTTGGVAAIINTLDELKLKGVKGKVVVSQYLNFTEPEALRRLLQFENIELRLATNVDAHAKGYLFKRADHYNLIVGSSNLTQTALSSNKEWNLQVSALKDSKILECVKSEFESDFKQAVVVTTKLIDEYEKVYQKKKLRLIQPEQEIESDKKFEPNRMQVDALSNLRDLRRMENSKALIISATGTGKTFLAAFDAKSFNPRRLLFVVHRFNIAEKGMETFKKVFGNDKSMGLYSGKNRELDKDFLFSTVQTISKPEHLAVFEKNHFDYIIIDESHRSGAASYLNLIKYFQPEFLLGMTATPERSDGNDIFKLFDHNIAYEIRLNQAMEEQMLCPFHYYGVTDLTIDNAEQDDLANFNRLVSEERLKHIIEKAKFYGTDNGICRGLIFTSKVEEAKELSKKFNQRGYNTIALSGDNTEEERKRAIEKLESDNESDRLDYIFTVDIFNEGIDIPKVNQVIMLRPTESAIIFIQQLGRGLRKLGSKSYLTVIDFIGNHSSNFLIPIALYGDKSHDKDRIRRSLSSGSRLMPGASTINFDKITKERIYQSIAQANMSLFTDLKKDYKLMKFKIGRVPYMMDFVQHGGRDPFAFVDHSDSMHNFYIRSDKEYEGEISSTGCKLLELFSKEINNSKRVEESIILSKLISDGSLPISGFKDLIKQKYGYDVSGETILSSVANLNFKFVREKKNGTLVPVNEVYKLDLVNIESDEFRLTKSFKDELLNDTFKSQLLDSAEYSIYEFDNQFKLDKWNNGFVLYRKYSRKDVFRILNFKENPVAQNVGGYLVSPDSSNCPIFVNYHKEDDISESTKYEDEFINPKQFDWMSKSNRTPKSKDVKTILGSLGPIRLPLFIKKNNDEGRDFYYMGDVKPMADNVQASTIKNDKGKLLPVVKIRYQLDQEVEPELYSYLQESPVNVNENKKGSKPSITKPKVKVFQIPLYNLYAAAGSFSEMQTSKEFTSIQVPERYAGDGYFAAKVVGESMNRRIPNGSICVFKHPVTGSRNGKILLVEYYNKQDPDMHSHFTIKTYSSTKSVDSEGWKHEAILLKPYSLDDSYEDIVITQEDLEENNFNVVGEFVKVLESPKQPTLF